MKYAHVVAAAVLGLAASAPAQAAIFGFAGAFDPATWTTTIIGTVGTGGSQNGNVDTSGAPGSVTITDGDDPSDITGCSLGNLQCQILYTHAAIGEIPITFNWSYLSTDGAGAQIDQFGYILDGIETNLSDPGGAAAQSGSTSLSPVGSFGFFFNCGDCQFGNASATISALQAPEPASIALLGIGLAGLGWGRRRRV